MKDNRKGFTLIETIVTIALASLACIMAAQSMATISGSLGRSQNRTEAQDILLSYGSLYKAGSNPASFPSSGTFATGKVFTFASSQASLDLSPATLEVTDLSISWKGRDGDVTLSRRFARAIVTP